MNEHLTIDSQRALKSVIDDVNAKGWGIGLGLTSGVGVFAATNLLVLKGGADVGSHLRLLHVYFPGYNVTFIGSLIGLSTPSSWDTSPVARSSRSTIALALDWMTGISSS